MTRIVGRPDMSPGIDRGLLKEVTEAEGTGLVGDHAAGATVLNVAAGAFRTSGTCRVLGTDYAYTRDGDTLAITPGLVAAAEDGDPVESLTPDGHVEKTLVAVIDLDMDGDPENDVRATIPGELVGYYPAGLAAAGTLVQVRDTAYGYEVATRPVDAPLLDARTLDPATTGPANLAAQDVLDAEAARIDADVAAINDAIVWHVRTFYAASAPTAENVGDIWFDTDDGYKMYRWDGSTWQTARDAGIALAQQTADSALTSANGKNRVHHKTTDPGTTANTDGDTWFKYDGANNIIAQWRGTGGTSWVSEALGHQVISSLDIGKATVGFLDVAQRVQANTITVDKLLVGFGRNHIANPGFETGQLAPHVVTNGATAIAGTNPVRSGSHAARVALPARGAGYGYFFTANGSQSDPKPHLPVKVGDVVRAEAWVRAGTVVGTPSIRAFIDQNNASGVRVTNLADSGTTVDVTITATYQKVSVEATVTDPTVTAAALALGFQNAADGDVVWIDDLHLSTKVTGELLVNGAVNANHFNGTTFSGVVMTAPLLQTHISANRGLKIVSSANGGFGSLICYDSAGNATFTLNGQTGSVAMKGDLTSGSTITGATLSAITTTSGSFNTATSGQRVEISHNLIDGSTNGSSIRFAHPTAGYGSAYLQLNLDPLYGDTFELGSHNEGAGRNAIRMHSATAGNGIYFAVGGRWLRTDGYVSAVGKIETNFTGTAGGFYDRVWEGGGSTSASINDNGRIVRTSSALRYKKYVHDLTIEEAKVTLGFRPVTYQWRADCDMGDRRMPGFIAEEVAAAGADLWTTYNADGLVEGVRYAELTAAHHALIADLYAQQAALADRLTAHEGIVP